MTSVKEISPPKAGEARNAHHGARASTIFHNTDNPDNNLSAIRLQFLMSRFGLDERRSALVAALAFEGGVI